jgi:hypothetical protein
MTMNLTLIFILAAIAVIAVMTMFAASPSVRDAALKLTRALPNGAATVYASPGIDLGKVTSQGSNPGEIEFLLSAPAMNTTQMPDAKTMKYSILLDTVDPIDGSSVAEHTDILTQTGAGGAGCAAASVRFRIRSDANRIVGFKIAGSASGDASGVSATLELLG